MDNKLSKAVTVVDVKNLIWFGSIIVAIMLSWNSLNTQIALTQRDLQQLSKSLEADQRNLENRVKILEVQIFGQKIADQSAVLR